MFKWLKEWGEEVKNRFQAVVPGYFGGGYLTSGIRTDLRDGDILWRTEKLSAGIYEWKLYLSGNTNQAGGVFKFCIRSAADDSNLFTQGISLSNLMFNEYSSLLVKIKEGESFRMIVVGDLTGNVEIGFIWVRRFPLKRGQ